MRLATLTMAFLTTSLVVLAQEPRVTDEMKKLQGTWVRVYVVVDGKKTEDGEKEPSKEVVLSIKGDSHDGDKFTLDPTKSPRHINVASVDDKGKATTLPGIYELTDGELKLCFPYPFEGKLDGTRPTGFDVKAGSNNVVEVYKLKKK
jgi:uncharacterized protein (TIGR03067 family)